MTHIEQGNYRGKHPEDAELNEQIANEIKNSSEDKKLACSKASRIAGQLGVSMAEVGRNADLLEIKVEKCLLGLFGYGGSKGKHRIVEPAETVSKELEQKIRNALEEGKLPCAAAWRIADESGMKKIEICAASDGLGIKTSRCQLGVF